MRKALLTLLALPLMGCQMTPEGMAFGRNLMLHAGREAISSQVNPRRTTNVHVYPPQPRQVPRQSSAPRQRQGPRYYNGILTDGRHYNGIIFNNIPHGHGVLTGTDKRNNEFSCEGGFRKGYLEGKGVMTGTDDKGFKFKYEGNFKRGVLEGKGVMIKTTASGKIFRFEGEFSRGNLIRRDKE